jgi:hypothetical protein
MSPIHLLLPLAGLLVVMQPAWADEQDACASNAGALLIGTVISGPRFVHGHDLRGVELSHTHVRLRGDHCEIPAGCQHTTKVGPEGIAYIVGKACRRPTMN